MTLTERISPKTLREHKAQHIPLAGLTAYDYPTAVLVDRAGVELILVGDSLGPMILGHERIEATTLADMIHHCRAVSRGAAHALVIGDLPFGAYEVSPQAAVEHAILLVKEGGVGAVKLEGGMEVVPAVQALAAARIPVVGHLTTAHVPITLTAPEEQEQALVAAAQALEAAGADAIVLVGLSADHAAAITAALQRIPSIGYQSGPHCDGQLLITPAMLGLLPAENPVPGPYGALGVQVREACTRFVQDVRTGTLADQMSGASTRAAHR